MNELLEQWFGFFLGDPWMLLIAIAIPPVLWYSSRRGEPAARVGNGEMFKNLPSTSRTRLAFLPKWLQVAAALLTILALARPVARERIPTTTEGTDILLAIDISSSMERTDMDNVGLKSRLDNVKEAAKTFVNARKSDRIGLLTFAAFPELRCPLTLDHTALQRFIRDTELVQRGSEQDRTGFGIAIARAAQILKNSEARSRVVVLLTDGQENVREIEPVEAAKLAKQFKVKVYTIGAGRGEAMMFATQPIDFTELIQVAKEADGQFFRAEDNNALSRTYEAIDALEKTKLADPRYRYEEKFYYLIIPGIVAFALSLFLRWFVFAPTP